MQCCVSLSLSLVVPRSLSGMWCGGPLPSSSSIALLSTLSCVCGLSSLSLSMCPLSSSPAVCGGLSLRCLYLSHLSSPSLQLSLLISHLSHPLSLARVCVCVCVSLSSLSLCVPLSLSLCVCVSSSLSLYLSLLSPLVSSLCVWGCCVCVCLSRLFSLCGPSLISLCVCVSLPLSLSLTLSLSPRSLSLSLCVRACVRVVTRWWWTGVMSLSEELG